MELLRQEQRTFYSQYFLMAAFSGVFIFLGLKFVAKMPDSFFVGLYPDLRALICVNIFVGLYLSDRKEVVLVYFARLYVLVNFSLFGFFTGCCVSYLSADVR
ncbi:hypothetical protein ACYZT2_19605 [Pseudomonas sp. MDT1-85]